MMATETEVAIAGPPPLSQFAPTGLRRATDTLNPLSSSGNYAYYSHSCAQNHHPRSFNIAQSSRLLIDHMLFLYLPGQKQAEFLSPAANDCRFQRCRPRPSCNAVTTVGNDPELRRLVRAVHPPDPDLSTQLFKIFRDLDESGFYERI
jgi:hypothetical protein